MSAVTRPIDSSISSRPSRSEPASAWILTLALAAMVVSIFVAEGSSLVHAFRSQWAELVFWMVLILAVNLLPLSIGEITLTLDMPVLLAVAFLYPPVLAGFVGAVAALDVRELEGRVPLVRALFNRFQVGICVIVASVSFHAVAGSTRETAHAALGTVLAIAAFHATNLMLVVGYTWLRTHSWSRLTIGGLVQFLITYLGYGALALVLARLFQDVGAWSVVTLVIPILVAREALLRAQRLQLLADELKDRERLLERLFDRIVDERKDERLRIGAELHDEVLQLLVRISQLAQFLRHGPVSNSTQAKDADEVLLVADQAIQELRGVVADLQSSPLGRGGLLPTLGGLARDLQLDWRVPVTLHAPPDLRLRGDEQLVLYQVAKEAVINALKHARPTAVSVRIRQADSSVFLEVVDDGEGFDPGAVDTSSHFGLGLIRERMKRQGGNLDVRSEMGHGTSLSVCLPRKVNPRNSPRA